MTNKTGTYEEKLPTGGTLKVSKSAWEISYYFPGPDGRYNGEFVSVHGLAIERHIAALIDNFAEYEQLKTQIPAGGDFSKVGKESMTIRLGRFHPGVCLRSYHMPISSAVQLNSVIGDYRYAAGRSPQIQNFLAAL